MKMIEALRVIAPVCAQQKGLVTTAQARCLGVDRMSLRRLVDRDLLSPVLRGVYRISGAPVTREDRIYAIWMSLQAKTEVTKRPVDHTDYVVCGVAAAYLLDLCEEDPNPIVFSYPSRKQSRSSSILYMKRSLQPNQVQVVAGIPTTTPSQTILDLVDSDADHRLVRSILQKAKERNTIKDLGQQLFEHTRFPKLRQYPELTPYWRQGQKLSLPSLVYAMRMSRWG